MSKKKKHQKQLNTEPQPEEVQKKPLKMPEITMTFDAMFSSALEQMLDRPEEEKAKEKEPEAYPVVILPEKHSTSRPREKDDVPHMISEEQAYLDAKVEQALANFVSAEENENEAIRSYQDDLSETEPIPEMPRRRVPVASQPERFKEKTPETELPKQKPPVIPPPEPPKEEPEISLPVVFPKKGPETSLPEPHREAVPKAPFAEPEFGLPSFMEQVAPLHETEAFDAPEVFTVPETPESDAPEVPEFFEVPAQPEEESPEVQEPVKEKEHSGWFRFRKKTQEQSTDTQPEPEQTPAALPVQEAPAELPAQEEAPAEEVQSEDTESLLLRIYSLLGDTDETEELPPKQDDTQPAEPDLSPTIRFSVPEEPIPQQKAPEQTVRIPDVKAWYSSPKQENREEPPAPASKQEREEEPPAAVSKPAPQLEAPADFWQELDELKTLVMSADVSVPEDEPQTAPILQEPDEAQQPEEAPLQPEAAPIRPRPAQPKDKFGFFKNRHAKRSDAPDAPAPETDEPAQSETLAEAPAQPEAPAKAPEKPEAPAEAPKASETQPEKDRHRASSGLTALAAAAAMVKPQHRPEEPTVIQSADVKPVSAQPQQTEDAPDDLQFLRRREKPSEDGAAGLKSAQTRRQKTTAQDVLRPDEAIRNYNRKLGTTGTRLVVAAFVTLLSLFFTLYGSFGWTFLPQEGNLAFTAYVLLALLLITAALAYDVFKDAVQKLKKTQFTAASLVAFALIVIVADTVQAAATDRVPFCTLASIPVVFLLWDKYDGIMGILTTLRTVCDIKEPKGIVEVPDVMKGRVGLSRAEGSVDDFMAKYETQPPTGKLMQFYAPITAVVCVILAALIASKSGTPFFWVLALLLLGAIPLIGILNFSRLFSILSKRLRASKAALCGWYGAETFGDEHSILVGDADLFPQSNIKFNGIKMISPSADRVIGYAAAAMKAVDSVLYPLFEEELRSRNGRHYRVDRYRFYESGGIGAQIAGDIVLLGTLDFMKRMGVHMEGGMKLKQAVYTSVNGELAAVFAIKYTPKESVSRGLTAIAGNRHFRTIFVTRDFLLTPELIREKYEISLNNTAYPPVKERIRLSETVFKEKGKQGALMADESFGSFTDAAAGGRVLKSAVRICMILTVLSGILGTVLMGLLASHSGFESATALNLLLYELAWAIPTLLLTGWTRRY